MDKDDHLDEGLLRRYVAGAASADEQFEVDSHLSACPTCLSRVRSLDRLHSGFDELLSGSPLARHRELVARLLALGVRPPLGGQESRLSSRLRTVWTRFLDLWSAPGAPQWALAGAGVATLTFVLVLLSRPATPGVGELVLRDSRGEFQLADGRLSLPEGMEVPESWRSRAGALLSQGRLKPFSSVADFISQASSSSAYLSVFRNDTNAPLPISPVATAVRPGRMVLRWSPVGGASLYHVLVRSQGGADRQTTVTNRTELVLDPGSDFPKGGTVYSWEVETTVRGELRLSGVARFLVLDAADLAELVAREKQFAGSELLLGTLYASYGLNEDARRQFEGLARMNPQSPTVERLVKGVSTTPPAP